MFKRNLECDKNMIVMKHIYDQKKKDRSMDHQRCKAMWSSHIQ